ncbi:hypothetical protein Gpo141_00011425 [Globisporangium polare]
MAEQNQEALASFMNITGAESASALQFLELTNWKLDEAVNLFMESGGQGFGGGGSDMPPPAPMGGAGYGNDEVRAPDPSKRQRLVGSAFEGMPLRRIHDQYRDFAAESIAAINAAAEPRIASAFGPGVDDSSSQPRDLSTLFQPPVAIMYQGTYADARMHAKNEGKWLLVNIQDEIVFASHMLNRDTWSDDVVQNLVASGFVFWQNYWASEHGKKFCTLYQIERETLPAVLIIDPRSGEIMQQWAGFLEPQDVTEKLSDFCCMNTMDAPASTSAPEPAPRRTIDDASEDDQLAAAIAASLQNGSDSEGFDDEEETKEEAIEEEEEEEVFETLEPEPADGTPGVTRVQIRAPDGSRLTRRFLKTDPMSKLWVFVKEQIPEARGRSFELRTAFPPAAIEFSEDATFAEKKLENASLMVKWT